MSERKTVFSPCRKYRYTLWREWDFQPPIWIESDGPKIANHFQYVQFIGLNPSTADETQDDPTVRRCIGFAKRWGFGALCMTNIFAWRDTDPEKMKSVDNPIGLFEADEEVGAKWQVNDLYLHAVAKGAGLVVAAWGTHGAHLGRGEHVRSLIPNLYCLGLNDDGTPKHPLYLSSETLPVPYGGTNTKS